MRKRVRHAATLCNPLGLGVLSVAVGAAVALIIPRVFAFYAALLAKWLDRPLLEWSGLVSGHTLKHGLAAWGAYWALCWLVRRQALARAAGRA